MDRYFWRKSLVVGIVFLLFFLAVNVTAATQMRAISDIDPNRGLFDLRSTLLVTWGNETQEPLQPGGAPRYIPLDISCMVTRGILGEYLLVYYRLTNQYLNISLELEEIPSCCRASLSTTQLQFPITDTPTHQTVILSLAVDETAPAYAALSLKINASVDDKRGPFGLFTIIEGYKTASSIAFIADYYPLIQVSLVENIIEITPGSTANVSINVKNLGNGKTTVLARIIGEIPKDWWVIITDQVDVEVNENKSMFLLIRTSPYFHGSELIILEFTPCFTYDFTKRGEPYSVMILVEANS